MFNSKLRVVVLTGSEKRHCYFIREFLKDSEVEVEKVFAEDDSLSLRNRISSKEEILVQHELSRSHSEFEILGDNTNILLNQKVKVIPKGSINSQHIISMINKIMPDVIVCFGSSLIRGDLIDLYRGKFLNVHLGLSPYYRGSGTNIWPYINAEPEYVGLTFMQLDEGIDTGAIIHQCQADFFLGDGVHTVGNRLIKKMTSTFLNLVKSRDYSARPMMTNIKNSKYYKRTDFTASACELLYDQLSRGLIDRWALTQGHQINLIEREDLML